MDRIDVSSADTSSTDGRALAQAQRELYDMLGISIQDPLRVGRTRSRSLSGPINSRAASSQRPLSELSAGSLRSSSFNGKRKSILPLNFVADDVSRFLLWFRRTTYLFAL